MTPRPSMRLRLNAPVCRIPSPNCRTNCGQGRIPRKAACDKRHVRDAGLNIGPTARRSYVLNAINPIEMDNPEAAYTTAVTRKIIQLTLEDAEIIELMRILFDDDAEGTLSFMRMHFKAVRPQNNWDKI